LAARLVPMEQALVELPALPVSAAEALKVRHGLPLELAEGRAAPGKLRVMSPEGRLLAVAEAVEGRLRYLRVML
ncbi:MAG TPA: tRNA pseudouridine(55) synthase TruB, partial [Aggregicoccus sp.]|nr:tRNA pseudouridine(55) synthase TruB [Aggregicoccus sp.]